MSAEVWAGILAVASSFVYVAATAIQQVGVLRTGSGGKRLVDLLASPIWLLGIALAVTGFLGHVAALALGSLALVSILQTSQIVFMLPFSAWTAHAKLTKREYLGAGLITLGLIGIVLFGNVTKGIDVPPSADWAWAVLVVVGVVVVLLVIAKAKPSATSVLYGTASGVLYGAMAGLIKTVLSIAGSDGIVGALTTWETYAMLLVSLGAVATQQVALGAGHLSTAMAAIIVSSPVASTLIALAIFGERFTSTGIEFVALIVSIIVSFVGVYVLPRQSLTLGADDASKAPTAPQPVSGAKGAGSNGLGKHHPHLHHGLPGPVPIAFPHVHPPRWLVRTGADVT